MEEPQYKRAGNITYDSDIKNVVHADRPFRIRLKWRLITWTAVMIMALLSTIPDPRAFYLIPMYPMGFDRAAGIAGSNGGGPVGYFVHITLFIAILASTKKRLFFIFSLILIIVCVMNTKGCHSIIEGLSIDG
jgi:hypothetical protein